MNVRFHPAEEQPGKALALTFFFGLVGSAIHAYVGDLWLTILLMALFIFSLRRFFLPNVYEFGEETLTVSGVSYSWKRFRSFERDRNGLFLSPYRERRKLDQMRGIFLPMAPSDRDRVAQWLRPMMEERRV